MSEAQMTHEYVIVRSKDAGVFAGLLVEHDRATRHAVLTNARRVWYWDGAATISQLAMEGTSRPDGCRFPIAVEMVTVGDVCEVLPVTSVARASIESVPVWSE